MIHHGDPCRSPWEAPVVGCACASGQVSLADNSKAGCWSAKNAPRSQARTNRAPGSDWFVRRTDQGDVLRRGRAMSLAKGLSSRRRQRQTASGKICQAAASRRQRSRCSWSSRSARAPAARKRGRCRHSGVGREPSRRRARAGVAFWSRQSDCSRTCGGDPGVFVAPAVDSANDAPLGRSPVRGSRVIAAAGAQVFDGGRGRVFRSYTTTTWPARLDIP
jgi:hypothetical protein